MEHWQRNFEANNLCASVKILEQYMCSAKGEVSSRAILFKVTHYCSASCYPHGQQRAISSISSCQHKEYFLVGVIPVKLNNIRQCTFEIAMCLLISN